MAETPSAIPSRPPPLYRCIGAGVLAGLASLVPGVSAGTMILAAGVYPALVAAVAEMSAGRFRRSSLRLLAVVVLSAVAAIVFVAGAARDAVLAWPSQFLALFLGLTLGGAPMLWRMTEQRRPRFWVAVAAGISLVVIPVLIVGPAGAGAGGLEASRPAFFGAGAIAAFTMVLPGVSGATLLVMIGMYLPYLDAMDRLRTALGAGGMDGGALWSAVSYVLPFVLGSVLGIVVAARLVRYLLRRFPQWTVGALLGLLLGATAGLWPFQTAAGELFTPTVTQAASCLVALGVGALLTTLLGRKRTPG